MTALRTRQRLRIRVPASPLSFVNALQAGSFGTWVHFRKVRRQPLLPIREGLPVTREQSPRCKVGQPRRVAIHRPVKELSEALVFFIVLARTDSRFFELRKAAESY
jgi:hypothetical protein